MKTTQFYVPQHHNAQRETHVDDETAMPANKKSSELKILKVLSLLIDYPCPELFLGDTLADCTEIVATSSLISPKVRAQIIDLIEDLIDTGCLDAQARYDGLFERGRSLSLWLFEHVHGESRDRGQAMVDLISQYQEAGFEISIKELPDYLPLYLEFLAYQATVLDDDIQIRMEIADISNIVALLAARLAQRGSNYQGCFNALLQIAGKPLEAIEPYQEKISKEKRDDTFEAIDKEWEEEVVDFMDAQQEARCPSQTSPSQTSHSQTSSQTQAHHTDAKKSAPIVDAPVHWVDFTTRQPITRP